MNFIFWPKIKYNNSISNYDYNSKEKFKGIYTRFE